MTESQEIALRVEFGTIEPATEHSLKQSFIEYFERAESWRQRAMAVQVTDITQTDVMAEARQIRLALRDIRTQAEKVRKSLKEESLRKGKTIDGIYNMLAYAIKPLEEHLAEQENYAQKLEDDRRKEYVLKRTPELAQYCEDAGLYDLGGMDEDVYQRLLTGFKEAYHYRLEAEKQAEAARAEKERMDTEERERMAHENRILKAQQVLHEEAERKQREELEAKITEERFKREALEAEIAYAKRQEQERIEAEERVKHAAMLAPDVERLRSFASDIGKMRIPQFHNEGIFFAVQGKIMHLEKELLQMVIDIDEGNNG